MKQWWKKFISAFSFSNFREKGLLWSSIAAVVAITIIFSIIGYFWNTEPVNFDVRDAALQYTEGDSKALVTGSIYTARLGFFR